MCVCVMILIIYGLLITEIGSCRPLRSCRKKIIIFFKIFSFENIAFALFYKFNYHTL